MACGRMRRRGLRRAVPALLTALLCACASTPLEDRSWQVVESRHFVAFTEGDLARARSTLADLEGFRTGLHWVMEVPEGAVQGKTRVVLFHDTVSAGRAMPSGAVGWADSRGGLIVGITNLPMQPQSQVMHHEYVHALRAALGQEAPRWYEEGIAETLSTLELDGGTLVLGRTPSRISEAEHARTEYGGAGASLRSILSDAAPPQSIMDTYADYWLLTHYLLFHRDPAEIAEYLRRWKGGEPSLDAFEEVFGDAGDFLVKDLAPYGRSTRRPIRRIVLREPPTVDTTTRTRSADAAEVEALFRKVREASEPQAPVGSGQEAP